ncbi:TPA: chromosome partitioning protein ParB, partial [Campylobacter lari]|nr:chromosome partitioning protein ParB [Campylobacter lari]
KQYQSIINLKEKIESLGLKVNAKDLKITINFENEDEVREFLKTLN